MEVAPAVAAGLVDVGRVVAVLDGHHPEPPARQLGGERHGERGLAAFFRPIIEMMRVAATVPSASREIVRGVHVEEQEVRVAAGRRTCVQREDADPDAVDGSRWRADRRARGCAAMAAPARRAVARRRAAPRPRRPPLSGRHTSWSSSPAGQRADERAARRTACPRRRRRPAPAPRSRRYRSRRASRAPAGRRARLEDRDATSRRPARSRPAAAARRARR